MLFQTTMDFLYPPQAIAIVELVKRRMGFQTSPQTSIYKTALKVLMYIYDGTFFENNTVIYEDVKNYNYEDSKKYVLSCKGDWLKIKQLFIQVMKNINFAKQIEYMPMKKDMFNKLTFSTFFSITYDNRFLFFDLINKPRQRFDFFQDSFIETLKDTMQESGFGTMVKTAESICEKHFTQNGRQVYLFWSAIKDLFGYWLKLKAYLPYVYNDLKARFVDGNLLKDYYGWLCETIRNYYGEHYIIEPWYFRAGSNNTNRLHGYFADYMVKNILKANLANTLNHNICYYYSLESFATIKNKKDDMVFETITGDEFIF